MIKFHIGLYFAASLMLGVSGTGYAQETNRSPFALEFPELNTGQLSNPRSFVARSDVNHVKFWVLNPAADSIEWNKIFVRINSQAANRICAQMASVQAKILRCNLNHFAGFRLSPRQNLFEIEAADRNGKRYFAAFTVVTDATVADKQGGPKGVRANLGFSGRKFAVLIGVSRYRYNDIGLGNLNYADADADSMNEWLIREGGFSSQDILHLTNEAATLSGVRDSLGRFLSKASETDLVLFFFAGHGTPDPFDPSVLYYLLHDSKVADLKNTGFPMTELKHIIDTKLRSKRAIFFLDTCHSAGVSGKQVVGLGRRGSGAGSRDLATGDFDERQLERVQVRNQVSQAATQLFGSEGRAVLASSDVSEVSREGRIWGGGHGVFTWTLLEGLRGNADENGDKVVTARELFEFVRNRVRMETNSKQNPRLFSTLTADLQISFVR